MANIHVGKIAAKDPDAIVIGTSSIQIVPQNYVRAGLTLINLSNNFISISFGGTAATIYKWITLTPGGGAWSMDEYTFSSEVINGVASSAGSTLTIQEYIA